eukprot:104362-Pelagomonas_calceolata.AAC.2
MTHSAKYVPSLATKQGFAKQSCTLCQKFSAVLGFHGPACKQDPGTCRNVCLLYSGSVTEPAISYESRLASESGCGYCTEPMSLRMDIIFGPAQ